MRCFFYLAEREGFEPSKDFKSLHDFQSCALDQLSHLSIPYSLANLRLRQSAFIYYHSFPDLSTYISKKFVFPKQNSKKSPASADTGLIA